MIKMHGAVLSLSVVWERVGDVCTCKFRLMLNQLLTRRKRSFKTWFSSFYKIPKQAEISKIIKLLPSDGNILQLIITRKFHEISIYYFWPRLCPPVFLLVRKLAIKVEERE